MCNTKSVKVVKQKPEGEFAEVDFDFGKVLVDKKIEASMMEEALIRELIRETQSLRKKSGLQVKEKITLTLNSDDQTNKLLSKYIKLLAKEVGAKKILVGKLQGKHEGILEFNNKKISIKFDRA